MTLADSMAESDAAGRATAEADPEVAADASRRESEQLDLWAEWAFAALAFVDYPLVDEIQYQLQRLRRACRKLLVALHSRRAPGAIGATAGLGVGAPPHAKPNLLLVIVTEVFGQR